MHGHKTASFGSVSVYIFTRQSWADTGLALSTVMTDALFSNVSISSFNSTRLATCTD
uniref:Uncharacterized protein n=1 Tax=Anguilla anguilla TaxID=7936 RepID=A0A0E9WWZ2_ANGAN